MDFRLKMPKREYLFNYRDGFRSTQDIVNDAQEIADRLGISLEEVVLRAVDDSKHTPPFTPECLRLSETDNIWPNFPAAQLNHVQECEFCWKLIKACYPFLYLRSVQEESKGIFAPNERYTNLNGKQEAVRFAANHFRNQCRNCLEPVTLNGDVIIFLPLWENQGSHILECGYCQLLRQYESGDGRLYNTCSCSDPRWCLGTECWQVYPVFGRDEMAEKPFEHIKNCGDCSFWAVSRFKMNYLRDREIYKKFAVYSRIGLVWRALVRNKIKRPVGLFISSWRFHFSPAGPFGKRHKWAMWDDEDRMLKLARSKDLLPAEKLYKNLLSQEKTLELCVSELKDILPKYSGENFPGGFRSNNRPLGKSWRDIEDYIRLEEESRERGISIEELKGEEERRREESQRRVEQQMYYEERYEDNLRSLHYDPLNPKDCVLKPPYQPSEGGSKEFFEFERERENEALNLLSLSAERIAELKSHLRECGECAAFFEAYAPHYWDHGEGCLRFDECRSFPEVFWFGRAGANMIERLNKVRLHLSDCGRCQFFLEVFNKSPEMLSKEHIGSCKCCQKTHKLLDQL